jgi:predicted nucleic acid-binding protein
VKAFLDVNVLLDVLAWREPHYAYSARVWALAETKAIDASVSVMSLPIVYYVSRRAQGAAGAWAGVRFIRDVFTLVPTDEQIIHQALDSGMTDFEDAIQLFSALRAGAAAMITRNTRHFPVQDLAIQTPEQFLATHFRGE